MESGGKQKKACEIPKQGLSSFIKDIYPDVKVLLDALRGLYCDINCFQKQLLALSPLTVTFRLWYLFFYFHRWHDVPAVLHCAHLRILEVSVDGW